jgi:Cd2+/Zn2+-exporting ATPase
MALASRLTFRIEGMDCGSCAAKIENALHRLPGIADIRISYVGQSLALALDEVATPRARVIDEIRALGFLAREGPASTRPTSAPHDHAGDCGHDHADDHDHRLDPADEPVAPRVQASGSAKRPHWWSLPKGRLVIANALSLAAAYAVGLANPAWTQAAFTVAALCGLAPVARHGLAAARSGSPFSIEILMSVAAVGAVAIGQAEEGAVVVFLFAVGELLEGVAAASARAGIRALIDLVPRTARRRNGLAIDMVPIESLAVGDLVAVYPGDRIPSDGIVVEGLSDVNEAAVTGEPMPVTKSAGAEVFAGSINANGRLDIRITRSAADNTVARIIHLVQEAQETKAPLARSIERFSRVYTPAAMAVALLVTLVPPLTFGAPWPVWIYRGLSVLLISCPCALVISTPTAIAAGLARAAGRGLLVKGGAALETLGLVQTVAFDKTGTLTSGTPRVTDIVALTTDSADLLAAAASIETSSSHPLARAIVAEAQDQGLVLENARSCVAIPGQAVAGRLARGLLTVGSPRHAAEAGPLAADLARTMADLEASGKTVVVVRVGQTIQGIIALRDEPRPDAAAGLAGLRDLGIRPVMLTGDNARTANAIGDALAIETQAELLPEHKLDAIAAFHREAPIAMVGDGINDAPALAAASVGIAMGGGTDVALETADATLLKNRIGGVAELIALSRATLANIRQNLVIALGLKATILVTALLGMTPLWMAILADTGATVLVTGNALRLSRFRFRER